MKEYIVQAITQETIDSFDTHNAPELIRCKYCKHYEEETGICDLYHAHGYAETWFCADGKRRETND